MNNPVTKTEMDAKIDALLSSIQARFDTIDGMLAVIDSKI